MPLHPLTNLEIQRCYRNETRFNRVYSRDNLPDKMKYAEFADIGTHWIVLYSIGNTKT